jgi:hypothetical protein
MLVVEGRPQRHLARLTALVYFTLDLVQEEKAAPMARVTGPKRRSSMASTPLFGASPSIWSPPSSTSGSTTASICSSTRSRDSAFQGPVQRSLQVGKGILFQRSSRIT